MPDPAYYTSPELLGTVLEQIGGMVFGVANWGKEKSKKESEE